MFFLSSFLWANETYNGLLNISLPFKFFNASWASSCFLNETNPKPHDISTSLFSSDFTFFVTTFADNISPYFSNSAFKISSLIFSSKYLIYKFDPLV